MLLVPAEPMAVADCGTSRGLDVGPFSKAQLGGSLPSGWCPLFPPDVAHTRYTLIRLRRHGAVVRAEADSSAAGLVRRIRVDPLLCWSWRIKNLIPGSDVHRKDGDDYPARVYVMLDYPPSRLGFLERLKYDLESHPPFRLMCHRKRLTLQHCHLVRHTAQRCV